MEHVLYADILFFINFSMDLITLYLTSRLTSGPPLRWRTVLSAILGGIWGTFAVAAGIDGVFGIALTGAVSIIMVLISFGYVRASLLLTRSAVFWGAASLLGGVMTALCSLSDSFGAPGSSSGGTAILFAGSALCLAVIRLTAKSRKQKSVGVSVTVGDRSARFDALMDSGNLATDPLSGRPVIIADRSVLLSAVPDLPQKDGGISDSLSLRIRMIPVKGIGGRDVLLGFVPDRVELTDRKGTRPCDAVIAVSYAGAGYFGGYSANAPSSLI